MTKSPTKTWLGALKRLMTSLPALHAEHGRNGVKPPGLRAVHPRGKAASPHRAGAAGDDVSAPRESHVRPRAAAWAGGSWTRSFHSAPPSPGRLVNHLSYGLYVPPVAASVSEPMPLVVMLHGCKQTVDEFAEGTRMNLLADANGFAVVYPEQSQHAHAHRCWHWYDDRDVAGRGEAHAVVSLVDALVAEHGFDAERVYVAGLSAGGGLASLLALHYPDRFAAVALHSAPAFGEAHSGITAMDVMRRGAHHDPIALADAAADVNAYPGMPAIIVHGDADRVVVPKNAEQLALELLRLNAFVDRAGTWVDGAMHESREGGALMHDYVKRGRSVVRLCRVPGLDHAWAGGDAAVPFHSQQGPNASALIWEFFRSQRRRQAVGAAVRHAAAGR
jgi:poly(hydroxyalkanoate) depolymerase family esterase